MTAPPERFFAGHLMWTRTGEVWACWRLAPLPRPVTAAASEATAASHAAMIRALVGHEFLLQGLLTWTEPLTIADRMLRGVELDDNLMWATETDATIDQLAEEPLGERVWFLSVRLVEADHRTRTIATAAFNELATSAGLSPLRPSTTSIAAYLAAAHRLEKTLPQEFSAHRATETEQVWMRRHQETRTATAPATAPLDLDLDAELAGRVAIGTPLLDEAATTDLSKPERTHLVGHLLRRPCLKVVSHTGQTSYQAALVLGQVPKHMTWPGTEFLGRIDDCGVPVDITIRAVVRSRHTALRKNQRSIRQLTDQLDHVEGAELSKAGTMLRLQRASDVLTEYHAEMEAMDREVEIEPVVMVSVAGTDPDQVIDLAQQLTNAPQFDEFTWARPIGAQRALFWAMRPGAPMSAQIRDYRQITRSGVFATAIPVTEHRLGREAGIPMAINTSSALTSLAWLDLFADAREQTSPSLAVVGEQGSGKSMFQKRLCGAVVARGGRMIATDNSTEREWVRFAAALDCSVGIVDTADPQASLDPLRILPPDLAGPVVQSFLITLLDVQATDTHGQTIAKAVTPTYMADHAITSLGALHRHFASTDCTLPGAAQIAAKIAVFSDPDMGGHLARALFDQTLPPLDMGARAIILATSNVELPTAEELSNAHRFRQLSVEKIFGRALYALIARLAKQICFADRSEPTIFDVDEGHHMTSSPEAVQVVKDFVRFGRRQLAAFVLGTHDPEGDIADETVRGLINHRVVLRLTKPDLAKAGTRFLGIDPHESPAEFDEFTRQILGIQAPGAGLYRDRYGRVGAIQLLPPAAPTLRAAAETTPPDTKPRPLPIAEEVG